MNNNFIGGNNNQYVDNNYINGNDNISGYSNMIIGSGNTASGTNMFVMGVGNTSSVGSYGTMIGQYHNNEGNYNIVSGLYNVATGSCNIIGGSGNLSETGGNIMGGYGNTVQIGSGLSLYIDSNIVSGNNNNILNSSDNIISGSLNNITDGFSNIVGGVSNIATGSCNIVSGVLNQVYSDNNIVSGQTNKVFSGADSTGADSTGADSNIVSGNLNQVYSFNNIVSGQTNKVFSGANYNIVGGVSNYVIGSGNIIGGFGCSESHNNSLILGNGLSSIFVASVGSQSTTTSTKLYEYNIADNAVYRGMSGSDIQGNVPSIISVKNNNTYNVPYRNIDMEIIWALNGSITTTVTGDYYPISFDIRDIIGIVSPTASQATFNMTYDLSYIGTSLSTSKTITLNGGIDYYSGTVNLKSQVYDYSNQYGVALALLTTANITGTDNLLPASTFFGTRIYIGFNRTVTNTATYKMTGKVRIFGTSFDN